MKITRYDITNDLTGSGCPIGIIMALNCFQFDFDEQELVDEITEDFDALLPVPKKQGRCFFTEDGERFFGEDIEDLCSLYEDNGLNVRKTILEENSLSPDDVVYRDLYQVVLRDEAVDSLLAVA